MARNLSIRSLFILRGLQQTVSCQNGIRRDRCALRQQIRKDYDLSILMTTHDFSMLPRYADRVVLIDHEVKRQGTPEEVLDSPEFRTAFHMKEGNA